MAVRLHADPEPNVLCGPLAARLVGKLVERAILSLRQAHKELTNLKTIIEREAAD